MIERGTPRQPPTLCDWADGPQRFVDPCGGYPTMVRRHLGMGITEEQRRRWVNLMQDAADEIALPDDPEFRAAFLGYVEWGTRIAKDNSRPDGAPPPDAPVPHWGWGVAPPYEG